MLERLAAVFACLKINLKKRGLLSFQLSVVKPKPKVSTLANGVRDANSAMTNDQSNVTSAKRGKLIGKKACEQVVILAHWVEKVLNASFANQSQSEVRQNQGGGKFSIYGLCYLRQSNLSSFCSIFRH